MARILVIDDYALLRTLVRQLLESQGHEVVEAANGAAGLQAYAAAPADLVITDLEMPVLDGFQVLRALRHTVPPAAVLAISGDPHALTQARTLTPYTLAKPFALQPLLATVQALVAAPQPLATSLGLESAQEPRRPIPHHQGLATSAEDSQLTADPSSAWRCGEQPQALTDITLSSDAMSRIQALERAGEHIPASAHAGRVRLILIGNDILAYVLKCHVSQLDSPFLLV